MPTKAGMDTEADLRQGQGRGQRYVRRIFNPQACELRPLNPCSSIRGESELAEHTRQHRVDTFDKHSAVISVPLLTFIDGFGLFRNMYRSPMRIYLINAAYTFRERPRQSIALPLTLGLHGSNFGDAVNALQALYHLDAGQVLDINGQNTFVCVYTLAYIGDMPQQQENSGFLSAKAKLSCRYCVTKESWHANIEYDVIANGRFHQDSYQSSCWFIPSPTSPSASSASSPSQIASSRDQPGVFAGSSRCKTTRCPQKLRWIRKPTYGGDCVIDAVLFRSGKRSDPELFYEIYGNSKNLTAWVNGGDPKGQRKGEGDRRRIASPVDDVYREMHAQLQADLNCLLAEQAAERRKKMANADRVANEALEDTRDKWVELDQKCRKAYSMGKEVGESNAVKNHAARWKAMDDQLDSDWRQLRIREQKLQQKEERLERLTGDCTSVQKADAAAQNKTIVAQAQEMERLNREGERLKQQGAAYVEG
ncbi:hypothetical protein MMC07_003603 [Pseudocyphellaria aurata]|nr:hypothetical protein [Pseudocyphellaria aurata]